ncbi:MAG: PriCT-2 domain-containing protein [Nevskiaceae bacterium]|jgi:hypothetical protein|nr:PriCT-2 domain-containing protein [Nevskiaceae bacterium]
MSASAHDEARSALFHLDPSCIRDDWVKIGMAAKAAGISFEDFNQWSSSAANYKGERDTAYMWKSLKGSGTTQRTLFYLARQAGWKPAQPDHAPRRATPIPRKSAQAEQTDEEEQRKHERMNTIWRQCQPIALCTVAAEYLLARGCLLPPAGSDLRWHPNLHHTPDNFDGPALVGLVRNAVTGQPQALHRTWIRSDGAKRGNPPRMALGPTSDGVVMLWPSDAVSMGLCIAEGIETALSMAHVWRPVWSVIDKGHLRKFPVLADVEGLTIWADNDSSGGGLDAARECARRWRDAGRSVSIRVAVDASNDANDLVRGAA